MTLEQFLNDSNGEFPEPASTGVESDWLYVATLRVPTGALWIGDPQFSWAEANEGEGCVIEVLEGEYRVEAKGIDFDGARFASRIRVYRNGSNDIVVGDECGEAGTDSGQIGVADQKALKAAFDAVCGDDVDAALDLLESGISSPMGTFQPDPDGEGRLVFLPSGVGDGGGPVLQLMSNDQCVGIEHQFIDLSTAF